MHDQVVLSEEKLILRNILYLSYTEYTKRQAQQKLASPSTY